MRNFNNSSLIEGIPISMVAAPKPLEPWLKTGQLTQVTQAFSIPLYSASHIYKFLHFL